MPIFVLRTVYVTILPLYSTHKCEGKHNETVANPRSARPGCLPQRGGQPITMAGNENETKIGRRGESVASLLDPPMQRPPWL